MSPKMRGFVAMAAMMALMSGGGEHQSHSASIVREIPNNRKKCFRNGCENTRSGTKLYCCAECNKLDKQDRKKQC